PEGSGFGGVRNLLTTSVPCGAFHVVTLLCEPGNGGIGLFLDGKPQGRRERSPTLLYMDELTAGARCFSNTPEPPHTQGFFDGDIAEILIFSRTFGDADRAGVERYLTEKYATLRSASEERLPGGLRPLEAVAQPPPVQMVVPGFTVRELPLALSNINNLKYR